MEEKCTFYVQANLNAIESARIIKACEGYKIPVKLFKLIPFSNKVPRLSAKEPFILLGSTTLNYNAVKSRKYRHGVFFDSQTFKPEAYEKFYGELYLNHGQKIFKLRDLPTDLYNPDDQVFIRSNDDSKNISGGTCNFSDLLEIQKNTETHWIQGDLFSLDSEICISQTKVIYAEYRLIICEKNIIGKSRYRPSIQYSVPDDILEFAEKAISIWTPHDVFVLDICETDDGLKIVECNCVNGAGWYDSDYSEVVYQLARYQEELWKKPLIQNLED